MAGGGEVVYVDTGGGPGTMVEILARGPGTDGFFAMMKEAARGWDGKDFTVAFVDPYRGPVTRPQDHLCKPIPYMEYANGIYFHEASHMFIASLWIGGQNEFGPAGLYFRTSPDLVRWSKPALAMTLNKMIQQEPEGNWSYEYFSLIDPKSTDLNYSTITDNPYLYYVRTDENHPPYQRVLFRQRINLNWLAKTQNR